MVGFRFTFAAPSRFLEQEMTRDRLTNSHVVFRSKMFIILKFKLYYSKINFYFRE